ncbi:MAG TPA: ABC transporter permease [Spirochaetia bacterium]|nr:ABC transporter permease [Spirochaetia bacterium]
MRTVGNLLRHDGRFRFGFVVTAALVALAILSLFIPWDPKLWNVFPRDRPISWTNPLGTNSMGQDIFWQTTVAIRNSLILGLVAAAISRVIALVIGLVAGYRGGILDRILMTVNDSFVIIPIFPLLILVSAILKGHMNVTILGFVLGLFGWQWDARLFRSMVLTLREREFTNTAVLSGMKAVRIVFSEHLPFVVPLVMAASLNNILWAIGMEVTLAVLGLSSLEIPTLGTMIYWAMQYQAIFLGIWNWILTPVVLCVLLILALYLLSVSISEYLDPRTRLMRIRLREE